MCSFPACWWWQWWSRRSWWWRWWRWWWWRGGGCCPVSILPWRLPPLDKPSVIIFPFTLTEWSSSWSRSCCRGLWSGWSWWSRFIKIEIMKTMIMIIMLRITMRIMNLMMMMAVTTMMMTDWLRGSLISGHLRHSSATTYPPKLTNWLRHFDE